MATFTAQSMIVSAPSREMRRAWIEERTRSTDEVLYIEEKPHKDSGKTVAIFVYDIEDLQVAVRSGKTHVRTIVVLDDAATIREDAQNKLLKLLEEPRPNLYIILGTATPMKLLSTIRSRCHMISLANDTEMPSLPAETAARITFMARGVASEADKLSRDKRYFTSQSKLFDEAKQFIGGDKFTRMAIIKRTCDKRDPALEFIDVLQYMYGTLLGARYNERLHHEADVLLKAQVAIAGNANAKLQMLRVIV